MFHRVAHGDAASWGDAHTAVHLQRSTYHFPPVHIFFFFLVLGVHGVEWGGGPNAAHFFWALWSGAWRWCAIQQCPVGREVLGLDFYACLVRVVFGFVSLHSNIIWFVFTRSERRVGFGPPNEARLEGPKGGRGGDGWNG